jgi:DNA mismatch endonuclease, patch repair protein
MSKDSNHSPPTPSTRRRMKATKGRDNPFEKALRSSLFRKGFRYRVHAKLIQGSRRTVDIAFLRPRVAVFLDGCFWHGCSMHGTWPKRNAGFWRAKILENRARDEDTNRRLSAAGWTVLRFWQHEEIDTVVYRIAGTLQGKHAGVVPKDSGG